MLHVICTQLCPGHLSVRVRNSLWHSEEIAKNLQLHFSTRLLLSLFIKANHAASTVSKTDAIEGILVVMPLIVRVIYVVNSNKNNKVLKLVIYAKISPKSGEPRDIAGERNNNNNNNL